MQSGDGRFDSVWAKSAIIAALTVLMLWPLACVQTLVNERQALQHQAEDVIAAGFGGKQILSPPILKIETQQRSLIVDKASNTSSEEWSPGAPLHLVPDDVRIAADVAVEIRRKGIYAVPVYVSKVIMTGAFKADDIAALLAANTDTRVLPAHAVLQLPMSGAKYLRAVTNIEIGGKALRPASGGVAGLEAFSAPIDLQAVDQTGALGFHLEFEVAGSESLHFLPLGSNTIVTARIGWPHPDFDGAFLPISHELDGHGYSAKWQVLEFNRAIPRIWRGTSMTSAALLGTAFGVRLYQPSNIYTQNYRAVRYGLLFIAITFVCFFAWEHLRGLRLHPMQYLLVGLALATFYLLLLAFSEHLGFTASYAIAAAALVALITAYIAGATANRKSAVALGAALAAAYGVLFVILLSEDYALLFGSLLLFSILAALMLATRRLDWATVGRRTSD